MRERLLRGRALAPLLALALLTPVPALAAGGESGVTDLIWRVVNLALLLGVLFFLAGNVLQSPAP